MASLLYGMNTYISRYSYDIIKNVSLTVIPWFIPKINIELNNPKNIELVGKPLHGSITDDDINTTTNTNIETDIELNNITTIKADHMSNNEINNTTNDIEIYNAVNNTNDINNINNTINTNKDSTALIEQHNIPYYLPHIRIHMPTVADIGGKALSTLIIDIPFYTLKQFYNNPFLTIITLYGILPPSVFKLLLPKLLSFIV